MLAVPHPREGGLRRGEIWDPLITFEWIQQSYSDLIQRWRTDPACVWNIKTTLNWAWPGSCDPISKFWDPLITFEWKDSASNLVWVTWPNFLISGPLIISEWIKQSASNLVKRWRTDHSCIGNIKRPLNGRGMGHVTQFRNVWPLITFERIELSASNLELRRGRAPPA